MFDCFDFNKDFIVIEVAICPKGNSNLIKKSKSGGGGEEVKSKDEIDGVLDLKNVKINKRGEY